MNTIREVIQRIIEKIATRNGYKRAWMEKHWEELVGEEASKHSRPYKIERDILFVSVDSSVWNQELFMKRSSLIVSINQKFTHKIVESIKYQSGQISVAGDENEASGLDLLANVSVSEQSTYALWDKSIMSRLQRKKDNR